MRRRILTIVFLFIAVNAISQHAGRRSAKLTSYSPDNPFIQYVGRVDFSNPKLPRFWQPGVYIKIKFKGSNCRIILNDEQLWGKNQNYLEIVFDGKPNRIQTKGKTDTIALYTDVPWAEHTLIICKNTEANIGYLELVQINVYELLQPDPLPSRKIEFIGNSITCGASSDPSSIPCGKGVWQDQHNAYMAYGPETARRLNAQYHLSAVSGIGLMHSCCNMDIIMPPVYDKISMRDNKIPWDFNKYTPDVVTICLGQNDGIQDSTAFSDNYITFIKQVRNHYPNATLVCLSSPMADGNLKEFMIKTLTAIVTTMNASGDKKVYKYIFSKQYTHGCDWHPDLKDHQEIADELTNFLRKTMNWGEYTMFDSNTDIGDVLHKGEVRYDDKLQQYTISGSGGNIWNNNDELHYLYKKMKGDFILQTRARFLGDGTDPHRKLGWMVRNTLDTSSVMICAALHGDGLTSLQFRKQNNGNVGEIRSTIQMPDNIQLERKGNKFILSVAKWGEPFTYTEVSDIPLNDEVYVGLFVCAHNKNVVEKALFGNTRTIVPARYNFRPYQDYIGSHIEEMDIKKGDRTIVHSSLRSLQAPNYKRDGGSLIYNSEGLIYTFDLKSKYTTSLETDTIRQNNNDHVISFDGKMLGLSSSSGEKEYGSLVYVVPIGGGMPRRVTPTGPSYLHGFSPDGKWMVFTGGRNNEYDIYKIPTAGGKEIRLTTSAGLDDGAEYSPKGDYIYFNSTRTGLMQLWRMKPDGSKQEAVTNDQYNNWFPHISPDGKWILFLSYLKDIKPDDHPFYKHVYLRLMPTDKSAPSKVVAYLYGGQGSINTPCWSPDGKKIAFVSNSDLSENK